MKYQSSNKRDDISDFSRGFDLLVKSLGDAAKKSSFSLGFGTLAFGISVYILSNLQTDKHIQVLIGLGFFFICAKIGSLFDKYFDKEKSILKQEKGEQLKKRLTTPKNNEGQLIVDKNKDKIELEANKNAI